LTGDDGDDDFAAVTFSSAAILILDANAKASTATIYPLFFYCK
jgi:hypothetical protein